VTGMTRERKIPDAVSLVFPLNTVFQSVTSYLMAYSVTVIIHLLHFEEKSNAKNSLKCLKAEDGIMGPHQLQRNTDENLSNSSAS
jgi:hypothetical protein